MSKGHTFYHNIIYCIRRKGKLFSSRKTGSPVREHSVFSAFPDGWIQRAVLHFQTSAELVKMLLFFWFMIQYFYIEKEKLVFTFTNDYGNMYLVKIGNNFNINKIMTNFPAVIVVKFIIFNYTTPLISGYIHNITAD